MPVVLNTRQNAGRFGAMRLPSELQLMMNEYILFMGNDATDINASEDTEKWGNYLTSLRNSGKFDGGSSIGPGERLRRNEPACKVESSFSGFIRVRAENLEDAKKYLVGNPVYEVGGTVLIHELPKD